MKKKPTRTVNKARDAKRQQGRMLHNILVSALWLVVLLPVILCIILFIRVGHLERELKEVKQINAEAAPGSFETELKAMALAAEAEDQEIDSLEDEKEDTSAAKPKKQKDFKEDQSKAETVAEPVSSSSIKDENEEDRKYVYLTFDDGPSDHTEDILELLESNEMTATFFCIGKTDEHSKEMYKRIVEGGHTLAMHSYSHDYTALYKSLDSFKEDFYKVQNYFEEITGVKPIYYRFPGGSSNTVSKVDMKKCIEFLDEKGVNYYDWNALNGDAEGKVYSIQDMLKRTMSGIKAYQKPMVLMHDTNAKQRTLEMLPKLIKKLKKMGAIVTGIDENTPLVQHVKVEDVVS